MNEGIHLDLDTWIVPGQDIRYTGIYIGVRTVQRIDYPVSTSCWIVLIIIIFIFYL